MILKELAAGNRRLATLRLRAFALIAFSEMREEQSIEDGVQRINRDRSFFAKLNSLLRFWKVVRLLDRKGRMAP